MVVLYGSRGGRDGADALLAQVLHRWTGATALPPTARTGAGKPFFPTLPQVHFNISHNGALLLCGGGDAPVGVDIERVRPRSTDLPRHALSAAEYDWYRRRGSCWTDFYQLWTLKESRCKYTGQGISRPARTIAVPLFEAGQQGALDGLTFCSYGGEGWRAAACTRLPEALPTCIFWPEGAPDEDC